MPVVNELSSRIMAGTKIRGKPIVLPPWWLAEVNKRFTELKNEKKITLEALASELTDAAHRQLKWDHKAVQRFLKNKVTTIEMMWAFLKVWPSLPQPVFIAHTARDAERLTDAVRRGESTPDWRNRYMELEEKLFEIAAPISDQTDAVASSNEAPNLSRNTRSRRSRSVD